MPRNALSKLAFSTSFVALMAVAGSALAADIRIDALEFDSPNGKQKVTIKNLEMINTNLTREDIVGVLQGNGDKKARMSILAKAKFDRLVIPEIAMNGTPGNEGQVILRNYIVIKYDQGRFERASIDSFAGKITQKESGGDVELKSGKIEAVDADFSKAIAQAAAGGGGDTPNGKISKFTWGGFDVSFPEKTRSGVISHAVRIGSINMESAYQGDLPTRGFGTIKDIVFTPGAGSSAAQSLSMFGYDKVQLSMNIDGVYDPAKQAFRLTDFSLAGPASGTLALTGQFGSIGPDAFRGDTGLARIGALLAGDVSSLALNYKDAGLFQKALVFYANTSGKDPQAVRGEWAGMVAGMLPMLAGGDPSIVKASAALAEFVRDPKSLNISIKGKNGPVKFGELQGIRDPQAALEKIELTVTANR